MLAAKAAYLVKQLAVPRWFPAHLERYRNQQLRQIVAYAWKKVPYYRELFDSHGVRLQDVQGISDLDKMPVTRKETVRKLHWQDKISADYNEKDKLIAHRTGGSTYEPMTLYTDPVTALRRDASIVRTYLENRAWPYDRCCVLMYHTFPQKLYHRFGIYKRHWVPYDASMEEQIHMIRHLAPSILEGYPSRLFLLANAVRESGITGISPKLIFTNSETLYDWIRTEIEAVFGTTPTVVYDCWEFGHIAWMCPKKKGLHVNEDLVVVEIVREDGTATEPGEPGEVVVTDLFNKGMPLIRYAMGDRAAWSEEPCACGHPFSTIKSVMGRMSEVFLRSDGSRLMATVICEMLLSTEGIREFQAVQEIAGELVLYIVAGEQFGDARQDALEQKTKAAFGFSSVEVRRVKKIEKTTSGKLKSIVPLSNEET